MYVALLGLTLVCELSLAAFLLRREPAKRSLLTVALLNLLTHPIAFTLFSAWGTRDGAFTLIESGVVTTEAIGYWLVLRLSWSKALAISASANGLTILLSFVL